MTSVFRAVAVAAILAGIGFSVPAMADAASDIAARTNAMKSFGGATKALKDAVADPAMHKAAIIENAEKLADGASKIVSWFPKGTGMSAGKTRAKDDIWSMSDEFKSKAMALEAAAKDLKAAAEAGNAAQVKAAFGAVGKSCGGCHSTFRGPRV